MFFCWNWQAFRFFLKISLLDVKFVAFDEDCCCLFTSGILVDMLKILNLYILLNSFKFDKEWYMSWIEQEKDNNESYHLATKIMKFRISASFSLLHKIFTTTANDLCWACMNFFQCLNTSPLKKSSYQHLIEYSSNSSFPKIKPKRIQPIYAHCHHFVYAIIR
jgi:hypothetical protein